MIIFLRFNSIIIQLSRGKHYSALLYICRPVFRAFQEPPPSFPLPFRSVRGDVELAVNPTSVLYTLKQPSWVVFTELTHTSKIHMKEVTVIEPEWLEVLAPHYYQRTRVKGPT